MSSRGKAALAATQSNRCEAATVMTRWKKEHNKDERCPFEARWVVEGHKFCMHHMRAQAVAICAEKGIVKKLFIPAPVSGQRVRLAK